MAKLCKKRYSIRTVLLCISIVFITRILFIPSSSIAKNEFDYSTVIYPSPFDANRRTLFIYFNKKDQLASNEDQISLSKRHKILDKGIREVNKNENFLLIE
jgi:hypothetical protein